MSQGSLKYLLTFARNNFGLELFAD